MTNDFARAYRRWRKYRESFEQLARLSDRDLRDIGVRRGDIHAIALKSARS